MNRQPLRYIFLVCLALISCQTQGNRTAATLHAARTRVPAEAFAHGTAPVRPRWAHTIPTTPRPLRVVATNGFEEKLEPEEVGVFAARGVNDGTSFAGKDRKAAKTSIATAPVENVSLTDLIAALHGQEDAMLQHEPPISKDPGSGRVVEEQRNVKVDGWVHFAKKEADNDYHVILGTSEEVDHAQFMNVEVSGLPPEDSNAFSRLKAARVTFEGTFLNAIHDGGGYTQFDPVHVRITGSLFHDVDHAPGAVGPNNFRPETAWEIHPVTNIEFAQ
jgi:hypothetical protein